jgi:hypothetical protein
MHGERRNNTEQADDDHDSGIFGYVNYLVEKDRKYILNTLINGKSLPQLRLWSGW